MKPIHPSRQSQLEMLAPECLRPVSGLSCKPAPSVKVNWKQLNLLNPSLSLSLIWMDSLCPIFSNVRVRAHIFVRRRPGPKHALNGQVKNTPPPAIYGPLSLINEQRRPHKGFKSTPVGQHVALSAFNKFPSNNWHDSNRQRQLIQVLI